VLHLSLQLGKTSSLEVEPNHQNPCGFGGHRIEIAGLCVIEDASANGGKDAVTVGTWGSPLNKEPKPSRQM
jgi:hypothetical protein